MSNISSYVDFYGGLSFLEKDFNLVDNVIFSELAYIDFAGIVPEIETGIGGWITLAAAYRLIMQKNKKVPVLKITGRVDEHTPFLGKLARSKRFGKARLSSYIDICDKDRQLQFAALCIELEDSTTYIAFRGTDQTIVGWREDFTMLYSAIPAQSEALGYLKRVMKKTGTYRLGGHSKGGHLAVFAAMMLDDAMKNRIKTIYNNDGPGIGADVMITDEFDKIKNKIRLILPEYCMIGAVFTNDVRRLIVKSRGIGAMQHDAMRWVVLGDSFVALRRIHPRSRRISIILRNWMNSMDYEERKAFVKHFFDALEAGGATRISQIPQSGLGSIGSVLSSMIKMEQGARVAGAKLRKSVTDDIVKKLKVRS